MAEAFANSYYIKLGQGGKYALEAIETGRLRFGWDSIPPAEIHRGEWESIRKRLATEHKHKGTVTMDTERLRDLVTTTPGDVWITFHDSHLWWGRVTTEPVRQDKVSKYRTLSTGWRKADVNGLASDD